MPKAILLPFAGFIVIHLMTFIQKKACLLSPKTYQNGENSMADSSTMTDP
jgi:hypothetical protein